MRLGYFVLFAVLFARLRSAYEIDRDLARLDGLTGLLNRRAFEDVSAGEIGRPARYGRPLSLAFVDLDFFKQVNDEFGHDTGDTVLREVTATLVATMRTSDVVARLFLGVVMSSQCSCRKPIRERLRGLLKRAAAH